MAVLCKSCNSIIAYTTDFLGFYDRNLVFSQISAVCESKGFLDCSHNLKSSIYCEHCQDTVGVFYIACTPAMQSLAGFYEIYISKVESSILSVSSLKGLYSTLSSLREEIIELERSITRCEDKEYVSMMS